MLFLCKLLLSFLLCSTKCRLDWYVFSYFEESWKSEDNLIALSAQSFTTSMFLTNSFVLLHPSFSDHSCTGFLRNSPLHWISWNNNHDEDFTNSTNESTPLKVFGFSEKNWFLKIWRYRPEVALGWFTGAWATPEKKKRKKEVYILHWVLNHILYICRYICLFFLTIFWNIECWV